MTDDSQHISVTATPTSVRATVFVVPNLWQINGLSKFSLASDTPSTLTTLGSLNQVRMAQHEVVYLSGDTDKVGVGKLVNRIVERSERAPPKDHNDALMREPKYSHTQRTFSRALSAATGDLILVISADSRLNVNGEVTIGDFIAELGSQKDSQWGWFEIDSKNCTKPLLAKVLNRLAKLTNAPEEEHGFFVDRLTLMALGGIPTSQNPLTDLFKQLRFRLPPRVAPVQLRSDLKAFATRPVRELLRRLIRKVANGL